MGSIIGFIKKIIIQYRILPIIWVRSLLSKLFQYIKYNRNYFLKSRELSDNRFEYGWKHRWPCLGDDTSTTGFDAHYIYHTGWAARIIMRLKPDVHVDIGSSLYFASILSSAIPVSFYDYRPAKIKLSGLLCDHADIRALPFEGGSIRSLSCMHVMEHVGLERYGDPFDPRGDLTGISELKRVLSPEGSLIFVVPVGGVPVLQFNAHRIYTYAQIADYFGEFELKEFALVTDSGDFLEHADKSDADAQHYGCGCFRFVNAIKNKVASGKNS